MNKMDISSNNSLNHHDEIAVYEGISKKNT